MCISPNQYTRLRNKFNILLNTPKFDKWTVTDWKKMINIATSQKPIPFDIRQDAHGFFILYYFYITGINKKISISKEIKLKMLEMIKHPIPNRFQKYRELIQQSQF